MADLPKFKNQHLLITALTHRSALNEQLSTSKESNERLEFLGDAVLELISSEHLFSKFPDEPEGNLTAFRSSLVKTTTLAEVARELKLGERLYMSKGEEVGGGRQNEGLLANTFEAFIGALYLDQGKKAVKEFLDKHLFPKFKKIYEQKLYIDPKSELQELVQAKGFNAPTYNIIKSTGPDHDKIFTAEVIINSERVATGTGKSKQSAHQNAAHQALSNFESN